MSKCSQKCNEIKEKIDSISGLDDNIVYDWLLRLSNTTDAIVNIIDTYAERNELNGTCFNKINKDVKDIDKLLVSHNIIPGYLGYDYIKTILESNILNSCMDIHRIYETVAKKFNIKNCAVERNIRTVLSKSNIHKPNKQSLYLLQIEYKGE